MWFLEFSYTLDDHALSALIEYKKSNNTDDQDCHVMVDNDE